MQAIKNSAKAVMEDFHDGLAHYDYTRILSCWDFPAEITMPEQTLKLETPQEMRSGLRALHEFYQAQGITKVKADLEFMHQTGEDEAICASKFRAIAESGKVKAKWTSSYLLRKSQRGWRITKANISAQLRTFQLAGQEAETIEPVA